MNRQQHFSLWYAFIAIAVVMLVHDYMVERSQVEVIPYSQFETALNAGDIADVTVSDTTVQGTYKAPGLGGQPRRFKAVRVAPELAQALNRAKVTYRGEPGPGAFQQILGWLLPNGMVSELGQVSYESDPAPLLGNSIETWKPPRYAESTAALIDKSVRERIDMAFIQARSTLASERALLDEAVVQLLDKETLSGEQLAQLLNRMLTPTGPAAPADHGVSVLPVDRHKPPDHAITPT